MEVGVGESRRPLLDDRIGDEPAQQSLDGLGVGAGGELEAPSGGCRTHRHAELVGGVDDGVGRRVGDAGMERDLDAGAIRFVPGPGLQQRVGEDPFEPPQVGVGQLAVDEHDVGDVDRSVDGQPERRRTGGDGAGPGVGVEGAHGEPVHRTGPGPRCPHCPDPRHGRPAARSF